VKPVNVCMVCNFGRTVYQLVYCFLRPIQILNKTKLTRDARKLNFQCCGFLV